MRSLLLALMFVLTACVRAHRQSEEILWSGRADTVLTYTSSAFMNERSALLFGYYPNPSDSAVVHRKPAFLGVIADRRTRAVRLLPKPDGKPFTFVRPQGVIDRRGTVHVVWAEHFKDVDSSSSGIAIRSLWSARLGEHGWSKPERIAVADEFYWSGVTESRLVTTADGSFHLVVAGYVRYTPGILHHFALKDDVWSVQPIPLPQPVGYATVAASDSFLSVGYISPAPVDGRDVNSVWYTSSSDNGRSWAPPVLVSKSGDHAATRPRVVRDGEGVVHLVWGQDRTGDLYAEALRHVQSADNGRTWSRPVDLPMEGVYSSLLDTGIDVHGRIYALHVVGLDTLKVAAFVGGAWTRPRDVETAFGYFDGGFMTRDAGGDIGAVWTGMRRIAPDEVQLAWLRTRFELGAR
jgi:hypothetical protein